MTKDSTPPMTAYTRHKSDYGPRARVLLGEYLVILGTVSVPPHKYTFPIMANRITRDAKCIVLGAAMAVCTLSLCSWVRAPRVVVQRVIVPTMAEYRAYYEAAESLIEQMRMDCDPYQDRFDYGEYWNAKRKLNK